MVCSVVIGTSSVDADGSKDVSGVSSEFSVEAIAVCAGGDCTSAIVCDVVDV